MVSRLNSIRTRLIVTFLLLVLIPIGFISAILAISGSQGARTQLAGELDIAAAFYEDRISVRIKSLRYELMGALVGENSLELIRTAVSSTPDSPAHRTTDSVLKDRFDRIIKHGARFEAIYLATPTGRITVSTAVKDSKPLKDILWAEQEAKRRISGVIPFDEKTIIVTQPVLDSNGRLLAVLAAKNSIGTFSDLLLIPRELGKSGKAYLVNAQGALLTELRDIPVGAHLNSQGIRDVLAAKSGGSGAYADFRGIKVIGCFRWIPELNAAVLVEQDESESARALFAILAVNASVALSAILVALFAALSFTRSVATPLEDFTETAGLIAAGNYTLKVYAERNDEIGALAQSFNYMTSQLSRLLDGLLESKEQYRSLINNVHIGVYRNDGQNGRMLNINPAMVKIFGYASEDEFLAVNMSDLYQNPADRAQFLRDVISTGFVMDRELCLKKKDGTPIICSATVTAQFDESGKVLLLDGVIEDITERKLFEERILRLNEDLEHRVIERTSQLESANIELTSVANELKKANDELKSAQSRILQQEKMASIGQLAAGVAHEINNPMGFIMSNLNTLIKYTDRISNYIKIVEDKLSAAAVKDPSHCEIKDSLCGEKSLLKLDYIIADIGELIRESLDGAERVKKIVQDLKSFSRLDEADFKMADINQGIESTINILWNELKYKVTLTKEYGDIPQTICNQGQLNQVFMNILLNAAQSIEKQGEVAVKTWFDGNNIFVSISDNGSGIPADKIQRIFEPFYTTKEVGKGTGLGLSIAYDIIKKHNGEIQVSSKLGKGTAFTISLPIVIK